MPLEVLNDDPSPGPPRCYFCGKQIANEADVRKTEYHVGHGQKIFVMICPVCTGKKARGEPPFGGQFNAAPIVGCVAVFVIIFVVFFAVIRPVFLEQDRPLLGPPPDSKPGGFRP